MSKKTPKEWIQYQDAREREGAQQYPNCHTWKRRCGSILEFDDSKGNESITLQHAGGSMIQLRPDGSVLHVSHNGQQTMIFGEDRRRVTGSQDTTVEGDSSVKTKGDKNDVTIGNRSTAVGEDDTSVVAGDSSTQVAGNIGVSSKTMSTMVEGAASFQAGGTYSVAAKGGMSFSSPQGASFQAEGGVTVGGKDVVIASASSTSMCSSETVAIDCKMLYINSGKSKSGEETTKFEPPQPQIA